VFHDLEAMYRLATRVAWMEDGRVAALGPAGELLGAMA
jgi:ABC-type proline/glycine betaine transport system ATPase subunit